MWKKKHIVKFTPCVNPEEIYDKVTNIVLDLVKTNPKAKIGLCVNLTSMNLYKHVVNKAKKLKISFKNVYTFNTELFLDIDKHFEQYYQPSWMKKNFFEPLNIPIENTYFPNRENMNSYDKMISKIGGLDLLILNSYIDGYLGFNAPYTKFKSTTHLSEIQPEIKFRLKDFFDEIINVPNFVITTGLKTNLLAKKIILLASGKEKNFSINVLLDNKLDKKFPVTSLCLHPDVTVYADLDALTALD